MNSKALPEAGSGERDNEVAPLREYKSDGAIAHDAAFLFRQDEAGPRQAKSVRNKAGKKNKRSGKKAQHGQGIHGKSGNNLSVRQKHQGARAAAGRARDSGKPFQNTGWREREDRENARCADGKQRDPAIDEAEFYLAGCPLIENDTHEYAAPYL